MSLLQHTGGSECQPAEEGDFPGGRAMDASVQEGSSRVFLQGSYASAPGELEVRQVQLGASYVLCSMLLTPPSFLRF